MRVVRTNASQPAVSRYKETSSKKQVALRYQSSLDREENLRAETKFVASRIGLIKDVFILLENDVNV
jgi:hypothetical protein